MSASSIAIRDVNTSSKNIKLNLNNSTTKVLDDRLQGNFVNDNAVNVSRWNLTDFEKSLLSKGLNFLLTSNRVDKAKLKTELETLGRLSR